MVTIPNLWLIVGCSPTLDKTPVASVLEIFPKKGELVTRQLRDVLKKKSAIENPRDFGVPLFETKPNNSGGPILSIV